MYNLAIYAIKSKYKHKRIYNSGTTLYIIAQIYTYIYM